MTRLIMRAGLTTLLALVPMIALDQLALVFDGVGAVAIRFVGAVLIFSAALALTDRFGAFRARPMDGCRSYCPR